VVYSIATNVETNAIDPRKVSAEYRNASQCTIIVALVSTFVAMLYTTAAQALGKSFLPLLCTNCDKHATPPNAQS
jgi:hypothetical protein